MELKFYLLYAFAKLRPSIAVAALSKLEKTRIASRRNEIQVFGTISYSCLFRFFTSDCQRNFHFRETSSEKNITAMFSNNSKTAIAKLKLYAERLSTFKKKYLIFRTYSLSKFNLNTCFWTIFYLHLFESYIWTKPVWVILLSLNLRWSVIVWQTTILIYKKILCFKFKTITNK